MRPTSAPQVRRTWRSIEQAQRHDETQIRRGISPPFRFERCRALRCLERQSYFIGWNVPQDLEQVVRVEADVERIAGVAHCQLVARLTQVWRLDAELEHAGIEGQPNAVGLVRGNNRHSAKRARQ